MNKNQETALSLGVVLALAIGGVAFVVAFPIAAIIILLLILVLK